MAALGALSSAADAILASALPPPSSEFVWTAYLAALHAVALCAFASLASQVDLFAALQPPAARLARARADLGLLRAMHLYPSLLWVVGASPMAVKGLTLVGMAAAVAGALQLVPQAASLAVCYAVYVSLDAAVFELHLPWDQAMMESLFWSALVPLGFAPAKLIIRLLFARLMLGFAKTKFLTAKWSKSRFYIREFLIAMPFPTRVGVWAARNLPDVGFYVMLVTMFVTEVMGPPLGLVPYAPWWLRFTAFTLAANLMLGINATGSFGHFNALTIAIAMPQLIPIEHDFAWTALPYFFAALILANFGSGLSNVWPFFLDELLPKPPGRIVGIISSFFRFVAPFRILNSYGVFPPHSFAPARCVPIFEARWSDDAEWQPLQFAHLPSAAHPQPRLLHPGAYLHTPRLDLKLFYLCRGMWHEGLLSNVMRADQPYAFCPDAGLIDRLVQRILEGAPAVLSYFGISGAPPICVRVRLALCLASQSESGSLEVKHSLVNDFIPPTGLDAQVWDSWLPPPELWHFDARQWRRISERKNMVQAFARAVEDAQSDDDVVLHRSVVRFDGKRSRESPVCIRLRDVKEALKLSPLLADASQRELDWSNWTPLRRRLVCISLLTLAVAEQSTMVRDHSAVGSWFAVSLCAHRALESCEGDLAKLKTLLQTRNLQLEPISARAESVGLWRTMYPNACLREATAGLINATVMDPQNSKFTSTGPGMFGVLAIVGRQHVGLKAHYVYLEESGDWELIV